MNSGGNKKRLRRKNDQLRRKIESMGGSMVMAEPIPAEIENQFLQNVLAFENYSKKKKKKRITILTKIGNPTHFKPHAEIDDEAIETEWTSLSEHMHKHGVDLSVCSPNVSSRELYRFATEELFNMEVFDFELPGMMTCFIYDEFYPDHQYENQRLAIEDCIDPLLSGKKLDEIYFAENIQVNGIPLSKPNLSMSLAIFHRNFEKISNIKVEARQCYLEEHSCVVTGIFSAHFQTQKKKEIKSGTWKVGLSLHKKYDYWQVVMVEINGIENLIG